MYMYAHFIHMTFSDHGSGRTFGSKEKKRKGLNVTKENKNGIKGKKK